jgi:hypothetical protein
MSSLPDALSWSSAAALAKLPARSRPPSAWERQLRIIIKRNGCVLALLVIAACGGESETNDTANGGKASGGVYEPMTSTQNDDGAVCLSQRPDGIAIRVVFDRCLSSSCDTVEAATCNATVVDGRITVSSQLQYRGPARPDSVCTADCGRATATCGELLVPEENYLISHGSEQRELSLPSSSPVQLFGNEGDCAIFLGD